MLSTSKEHSSTRITECITQCLLFSSMVHSPTTAWPCPRIRPSKQLEIKNPNKWHTIKTIIMVSLLTVDLASKWHRTETFIKISVILKVDLTSKSDMVKSSRCSDAQTYPRLQCLKSQPPGGHNLA